MEPGIPLGCPTCHTRGACTATQQGLGPPGRQADRRAPGSWLDLGSRREPSGTPAWHPGIPALQQQHTQVGAHLLPRKVNRHPDRCCRPVRHAGGLAEHLEGSSKPRERTSRDPGVHACPARSHRPRASLAGGSEKCMPPAGPHGARRRPRPRACVGVNSRVRHRQDLGEDATRDRTGARVRNAAPGPHVQCPAPAQRGSNFAIGKTSARGARPPPASSGPRSQQ